MAKSKKPKPEAKLYHKGKPLTKFKTDFVKKVAETTHTKVDTPKKLKKFYEDNKELFYNRFESGLTSIPKSSTQVFEKLDEAQRYNKKFFIEDKTGLRPATANELKYKISETELNLNTLFEGTGAEFSYKLDFENNIIMTFPDFEQEEDYTNESMEIIVDHFSEDYGINLYISEPKNKEQRERHKEYRDEYTNKVKSRIKQYKPKSKLGKSNRKKTTKGGNKRKKN